MFLGNIFEFVVITSVVRVGLVVLGTVTAGTMTLTIAHVKYATKMHSEHKYNFLSFSSNMQYNIINIPIQYQYPNLIHQNQYRAMPFQTFLLQNDDNYCEENDNLSLSILSDTPLHLSLTKNKILYSSTQCTI